MDRKQQEIPRRVAFYIRVSTDDQAEKFGPNVQRSAVEALLKTKLNMNSGQPSFVFAGENHVYNDDISGTVKLEERPGFRKLMEDYLLAPKGNKPFDTVAVFKIDRFARKLRILMDTVEFFEENKIEFLSATESIDTSTPFGKAMLGIMGVLAELERENILARTRGGREEAIKQGKLMGANAPYGYNKDENGHLVILKEESDVVEMIFGLFTTGGLSPQKIADTLQEQKMVSPEISAINNNKRKGKPRKTNPIHFWRMETVRSILEDEVYIGTRYYDKTVKSKRLPKGEWKLSPYKHEPIIPQPLFDLAQKILKEVSARRTLAQRKVDQHFYLLSGLLKCDHCRSLGGSKESEWSWTGARKYVGKKLDFSYYYQCNRKNKKKYPQNNCPVIPIPADELEEYVIEFVKQLLSNPKATYEYQKGLDSSRINIDRLKKERKRWTKILNAIPKIKTNILNQHAHGHIDIEELNKQIAELKKQESNCNESIKKIDFELAQESLSKGYVYSLELYAKKYEKALNKAEKDEKELYELIHMIIDQVVVYARPKTDKDRIAGVPKKDQLIPDKIDIQLNLPQYLIQQLLADKFGVKHANL